MVKFFLLLALLLTSPALADTQRTITLPEGAIPRTKAEQEAHDRALCKNPELVADKENLPSAEVCAAFITQEKNDEARHHERSIQYGHPAELTQPAEPVQPVQ